MVLYLRLLDSARDGADWREAVRVLFGLNPEHEPERCRLIHDTHLARARWMTEHGYRELVRESQQSCGRRDAATASRFAETSTSPRQNTRES